MNEIAGIPYAEAEFDQDGKLISNPQVPSGTTDLIVISHGWKNARAGGGAASLDDGEALDPQKMMTDAINRAAILFDEAKEKIQLAKLRALVPELEGNEAKQGEFVQTLRALLDPENEQAATQSDEDASKRFFQGNPQDVFEKRRIKRRAAPVISRCRRRLPLGKRRSARERERRRASPVSFPE